jgi:signal peptidase I
MSSALVESRPRRRWSLVLPAATLGIVFVLPLATLLMTAFLMGWRFQPIETASMAPHYPAGSLAVVVPIDPAEVRPGMPIVFVDPMEPTRLVAHRAIRQVDSEPPAWRTQGDANRDIDPLPVRAAAIQGRVAWAIPGLGEVVMAVRGGPAVILLVVMPLSILALTELRDVWRRGRSARAAA